MTECNREPPFCGNLAAKIGCYGPGTGMVKTCFSWLPFKGYQAYAMTCFYVAQGQSTLMRADHRMGFSNPIVSLQVNAGLTVTGVVP